MTLERTEQIAYFASLKYLAGYESVINRVLKAALDDIRAIIVQTHSKYAVKGVLTNSEMSKYNRMVNLEKQVLEALDPAIRSNVATLTKLPPQVYNHAFYQYAWAMDNGNGVRMQWGTLNLDAVKANLENPIAILSTRQKYPFDAKIRIRQALNEGLPLGVSLRDMAGNIKKAMDTTAANAIRIARTEGMTALNAGQSALYARAQQQGIEGREIWDATLDGRTRESHQIMDGQARRDDGTFAGPSGYSARYPLDPGLPASERISCRCRLRFEVEGYAPILRRQRDQGVIPYQTYQQWAKGN